MDRPDPKDRSFSPTQLAREHAEDEQLAQQVAQEAHTLMPPEIAERLPPLYSQEEQGENAIARSRFAGWNGRACSSFTDTTYAVGTP